MPLRVVHPKLHWNRNSLLRSLPALAPCISSSGCSCVSFNIPHNKSVTVSKVLSWGLWTILANHWACGGCAGEPQFIAWDLRVASEWMQACGTEPLTCGVCANVGQLMSELSEVVGNSVSLHQELENRMVWEKPHIWCQNQGYREKVFFPFIWWQVKFISNDCPHHVLSALSTDIPSSLLQPVAHSSASWPGPGWWQQRGEMVQWADWSPPASCGKRERSEARTWSKRCLKDAYPPCYAKLLQSCLTLYNPIDGSPPGSSVHRILQARILEWVAISFCRFPITSA